MKKIPDYTLIFQDNNIAVLNKRSGMLSAADRYEPEKTYLTVEAEKELGKLYPVHRLDKDTSGIIIYARNKEAHTFLSGEFEKHEVEKIYHCLIYGCPIWKEKKVCLPLLPDADDRHRTLVNHRKGKPSVTDFRILGSCSLYSWVEAKPQTGRTHQIRTHLKAIGSSIVCDPLYGGNQKPIRLSGIKKNWRGDSFEEVPLLSRLALHAYQISFRHPETNSIMTFKAPYPKDMEAVRKQFLKIFKINSMAEN